MDQHMPMVIMVMVAVNGVMFLAVPSVICVLLFRTGPLLFLFGIATVTRDGVRASRLRMLWRAVVCWSPLVLTVVLAVVVDAARPGTPLTYAAAVPSLLLAISSASMPLRGIPDRLAVTYPVPR